MVFPSQVPTKYDVFLDFSHYLLPDFHFLSLFLTFMHKGIINKKASF